MLDIKWIKENAEYAKERLATRQKDYSAEIDRMERQEAIDREMNAPTSTPITTKPATAKVDTKTGRAADEYKKAFWNATRTRDGISHEVRNALQVGADSEGGYLVPDEFEHRIVQAMAEKNVMRKLGTVMQTERTMTFPIGKGIGFAEWVPEEGEFPIVAAEFDEVKLGAHKVATSIRVSDELLEDSVFDLEEFIIKEFANCFKNFIHCFVFCFAFFTYATKCIKESCGCSISNCSITDCCLKKSLSFVVSSFELCKVFGSVH